MDLDAESVTDAKNNLNTARWAVYFTNTSCLDLPSEFSFDAKQTRGSSVAVLIRHLPSANCFDTLFQPELTFYAASETHLYPSLSHSQHLFTYASFLCIFTCHMMILHPQLVVNSCSEYTTINVACSVKTDKGCFTPIYLKQAKDNKRGKILTTQSTDFGYSFVSFFPRRIIHAAERFLCCVTVVWLFVSCYPGKVSGRLNMVTVIWLDSFL